MIAFLPLLFSLFGHRAYLHAISTSFGGDVDYAMLVKLYSPSPEGERRYSPAQYAPLSSASRVILTRSTSYAERNNLNVRMHSRRLTRLRRATPSK
jgi:hypothetical protein